MGCNDNMAESAALSDTNLILAESGSVVEFNPRLNQLSISAAQQNLKDVLADISYATGIIFVDYADRGCELASVQIETLSLYDALSSLIGDRSYIVQEA